MAFTKGELLQHSIAFALRNVRLYGRRLGLTEEARVRVAAETIRELRKHGEWRELDDPLTAATQLRIRMTDGRPCFAPECCSPALVAR